MISSAKSFGRDLTQGSIAKGLLFFVIPIVASNLLQQFYSMVDLMVIGKFVGTTGTVGVSVGSEISDILTPISTGFAGAIQIYIAQLFGAKKYDEQKKAMGTSVSVMVLVAITFAALIAIFNVPILKLINCPDEAFTQAQQYLLISLIGVPFIFAYNAVCGILRGMGESKRPLYFVIVATVVNIVLDIILVAVFRLDAAGTAIATVFSQMASFIAAFIFLLKHRYDIGFDLSLNSLKIDRHIAFTVFVKLGIPTALRSTLVRLSMLWITASINTYGLIVSGTSAVGSKLIKFCEVFTQSIADSGGGMVGQNIGAKKIDRVKKSVYASLIFCLISCAAVIALFWICPSFLFSLFTNDVAVINMGIDYLHIMSIFFLVSAIICGYQTIVIGSGAAGMNLFIGILDGVVCKIGLSLIFSSVFNLEAYGYFWGMALSRVLPMIIVVIYFYSGAWKKKHLIE